MRDRGVRVHCLGIGDASQDRFLALLARETGGISRFMTPQERVDMAALELFASVGRPAATEVTCTVTGSPDAKISPAPSRMVFAGTPLAVYGSCAAEGKGVLHLAFDGASGPGTLDCPITISSEELGETLGLLRGARVITDLESQFSQASAGDTAKSRRSARRAEQMLQKASEEYRLSSQCMSLVAVIKREGDVEGELPETRVIPVGMPQDTRFDSYFMRGASAMQSAPDVSPIKNAEASFLALEYDMGSERRMFDRDVRLYERDLSLTSDSDDVLVELAALLEPDGGMPGDTPEERLLASLLALLTFHGEGHIPDHGPFALHMKRLVAYLKQADLSPLNDDQRDIVTRVLKAIGGKGAIPVRKCLSPELDLTIRPEFGSLTLNEIGG